MSANSVAHVKRRNDESELINSNPKSCKMLTIIAFGAVIMVINKWKRLKGKKCSNFFCQEMFMEWVSIQGHINHTNTRQGPFSHMRRQDFLGCTFVLPKS